MACIPCLDKGVRKPSEVYPNTTEYRNDFSSLYAHAKSVSKKNDIPIEFIFEDLIYKNLTDLS